jgi:hypothetical protein
MEDISLNTYNESSVNNNDYLQQRNKKYFVGHIKTIHPLYELELKNAVSSITNFLHFTILNQAYFQRLKRIYTHSAEKCWNNINNNYTFAEAEVCEENLLEKDSILNNINEFKKEIQVRIQDDYEKKVKYEESNTQSDMRNINLSKFETSHRSFLLNLHEQGRLEYYNLAKELFLE